MNWKLVTPLLLTVCATTVLAQSGGLANISGVAKDQSGSVVPNAKVVVSNTAQGISRTIQTNGAGLFAAPALTPGKDYSVAVTATGFAPYELKNIELRVGQNLDLTVTLSVAQSSTSVQVSDAAPLVDDTKKDVSNVVGQQQIDSLPINGRRVDSFVLLTPGVTNDATFGLLTFRGVAGNNSFLLDGNDNTEQFYDENAGRTRMVSQVSQDAVQEFQVVSSNVSAEYGKAMGGVVNTVTRSGTNEFHGAGFYFFRSTGFDARDPFAAFTPTEHRVQTGGTLGGPIVKNKLFFLISSDITRRNFPMVDSLTQNGVIDPIAQKWIGCGTPSNATEPAASASQCSAINTLLPRFFGAIPRTAQNDLYFGRADYHFSDRNTFSASFNYLRWKSNNGIQTGAVSTSGSAINGNGDDYVRVRNGKFAWTSVPSSNIVNEFRYGWNTDRQADDFDSAELGGGLGLLNVSVAGANIGPANYLPRVEPSETRHQFADDLTWSKGVHTFKAGIDFASTEDYVFYAPNLWGTYTYQTVNQFALDYGSTSGTKYWQRYSQLFGNPVADYTIKELALYIQDQWRVTQKLTLNLGARYERSYVPAPSIFNPDFPQTGKIPTGKLNLEPRLGLAYKIDDKTVVRAGFGTFHARFLGGLVDNLYTTNAVFQISDTLNSTTPAQLAAGPVFPNRLAAPPAGASVGAASIQFLQPGIKTPYTEQFSLSAERQLLKDTVITVSALHTHGVNLFGVQDLNLPNPTTSFTYRINDTSGNQVGSFSTPVYTGTRPNSKYGAVLQVTNGVSSFYDALTVSLEKRFSHGFQALTSYTWAHEIDDGQGAGGNAIFFSSASPWTYNGNYGYDKGSGTLDQRHRLVQSFVWSPEFTKRTDFFSRYVINNWQMSGIATFQSGRPSGSETIRVTDTPVAGMISSSSLNGLGANSRAPFLPVNGLYTPAAYRGDIRISKIIPWGGLDNNYRKLFLNFEVFNISNSWSPTSLSTQGYTEAKGVLTPTPASFNVGTADGGFPDGTQARRMQISARVTF